MTIYKYKDADGKIVFSDKPPPVGASSIPAPPPNEDGTSSGPDNKCYGQIQCYDVTAKDAAKYGKKLSKYEQYVDALNTLRSHNEGAFMRETELLKKSNPKAWIKLQGTPSMANLNELKAGEGSIGSGVGLITKSDDFETWFEAGVKRINAIGKQRGTVTDMSKASTAIGTSSLGVLKAGGVAVTRVIGVVTDVAVAALDPQVGDSAAVIAATEKLRKLREMGVIDIAEPLHEEIMTLISNGNLGQAGKLMDAAKKAATIKLQ